MEGASSTSAENDKLRLFSTVAFLLGLLQGGSVTHQQKRNPNVLWGSVFTVLYHYRISIYPGKYLYIHWPHFYTQTSV